MTNKKAVNRISVIIVHYKGEDELVKCLDSIKHIYNKHPEYEYVFVNNNLDNNKIYTLLKNKYSFIKYYSTNKNLGWGGGRNFGISKSSGDMILSLDSDITISEKSVIELVRYLNNHKNVGIVSPALKNITGSFHGNASRELTPVKGIFFLSFLNKYFSKTRLIKNYLIEGWDRKTVRIVDVVQLAAFLIRRKTYEDIGGFDEKIFLYFEENDISLMLKNKNWKLSLLPTSEPAIHLESKGTGKDKKEIKRIFRMSRFYYFKKHYGILSALIVEMFARMSKNVAFVLLFLAIGTFLRFYRFIPNFIFNGEMGTDYLNVWGMLHGTHSWFIGPRTSHEWFFIPPLAYWIYVPVLLIGKLSPIAINIFWGIVGSLAIPVSYYYIKKLFNEKIALISSFLVAVSPAWIAQTRASRYNLVVSILFLPYLYFLNKSVKDNGKSLFKLGIILGLMMSFFPSPLLLIPASILCFVFYKVKPKMKNIWKFVLGFIIPNITFLIYDASHKFTITTQLLTWVPYRVLGFFGIYHKNTVDSVILNQNATSIFKYISNTFLITSNFISILLFAIVIIGVIFWSWKNYSLKDREKSFYILLINFIVCYVGLFIHGNPPEHYYYTIYAIPVIFIAYFIDKLIKNKYITIATTLIIGALGVSSLFTSGWYFTDKKPIDYKINPVPFNTQLKIVDVIISDANGSNFSLARVGVNDQFENNFANNYVYLLQLKNIVPDGSVATKYTIVEGDSGSEENIGKNIFSEDNVSIYKLQK